MQDLFAKNLHAENVHADRGTFAEICVKDSGGQTCLTRLELDQLLELRDSSEEAADTQQEAIHEAPAASPAPTAEVSADTATTTTPSEIVPNISEASAPPELSGEPDATEPPPAQTPELEAANDNFSAEALPATGTE